jgi:hypothetical protein
MTMENSRSRVLSGTQVRLSTNPIRVGGARPSPAACEPGKATVQEVRDAGGRLKEIHVQCECGVVTVVGCDYAA